MNNPSILRQVLENVSFLIQRLQSLVANHRYHLDDILAIVRPLVYVYAVLRCGRRAWGPIKVAMVVDGVMLVTTVSRIVRDEATRKDTN